MKAILAFILTIFFTTTLYSTPQIPDKIIYKGTEYELLTFPLESFFEKHPDKRPKTKGQCTGLWRNYVATFEIRNNQLFLKDIQIMLYNSKSQNDTYKSVINKVFPNQKNIKAEWVTELLEVASGELVDYGSKCYGCKTYENYILLEINKGDLIKEARFNYTQYDEFKLKQFQEFKKTEEYNKLVAELKREGFESIDSFICRSIIEYTTKILTDK